MRDSLSLDRSLEAIAHKMRSYHESFLQEPACWR